jgi:hypothetical protein
LIHSLPSWKNSNVYIKDIGHYCQYFEMKKTLPSYAESHACVLKRTTARKHGFLDGGGMRGG